MANKENITITVGGPDSGTTTSSGTVVPKYGVGKKCRGKVVNFKPYGFFVETDEGKFGLVHGRNIKGWDWTQRFNRVFPLGMELEVTVIDFEADTDRVSFASEMPSQPLPTEVPPAPVAEEPTANEPLPPPAFDEIAEAWIAKEPEKSKLAFEWLKRELEDGPLYGPLTTILCDRFDVPVPVSRWIRRFPDVTCYSGKGDNPSDLPAVALSARAGDVAYWQRIKTKTGELLEERNRREDPTARLAALVSRLDALPDFPGARWIRDYMAACRGLIRGNGIYGASDTVERLAIPMLGQLGWHVSADNAAFVRGGAGTGFNAVIYNGPFGSGKIAVALLGADAGTAFDSLRDLTANPSSINERNAVEKMLCLFNQIGGDDESPTKLVWSNGIEWVVIPQAVIKRRLGIIADHRGGEIMDAAPDSENALGRVTLPTDGEVSTWLAAFAELHQLLGTSDL